MNPNNAIRALVSIILCATMMPAEAQEAGDLDRLREACPKPRERSPQRGRPVPTEPWLGPE